MRWFFTVFASLALGLAMTAGSFAAEAGTPAKIRVLLLYGGHAFEETKFFAMFDALSGIQYTKAAMPKAAALLKPGLEKDYDVIVRYDMGGSPTPEQKAAFVALLQRGIGLVSLHHSIAAFPDWDEYHKILGVHYYLKAVDTPTEEHIRSKWHEGQTIHVAVADREHPITHGLSDFTIHDETYCAYDVSPAVRVLLTTDHPENERTIAWVNQYGKSRIFYFQLGHGSQAWQNPAYPEILGRAIHWAAGR